MPASVSLAARAAAALAAYKYGARMPGGPIVAALAAWIVADLVLDRLDKR
jgi:hypothetical protein